MTELRLRPTSNTLGAPNYRIVRHKAREAGENRREHKQALFRCTMITLATTQGIIIYFHGVLPKLLY